MAEIDETIIDEKIRAFIQTLSEWYGANKRQLPFRGLTDPYNIWVSEVLLQQTQISRGVEYYARFVERFPTVNDLASATWEEFFPYFKGLGYYNRGRNMLKTAKIVANDYAGRFPDTFEELQMLPGIGAYTANAIMSFAFQKTALPQDTNINRILGRVFLGVHSIDRKTKKSEALLARLLLGYEKTSSSAVNQAMMDFGWQVCSAKKPYCMFCPLQAQCLYFKKELPCYIRTRKRLPRDYEAKFPMAVIMHKKKALLFGESLLGGLIELGDERSFLKQLAQERYGVEISVRSSYKTWIANGIKYSLHRCYLLLEDAEVQKLRPLVVESQDIWRYIDISVQHAES